MTIHFTRLFLTAAAFVGVATGDEFRSKIEEARDHWAYQRPSRTQLPQVSKPFAARNPIDRFIIARLDTEGLGLSGEAERAVLLRRVSLDLIGLSPSIGELNAYLSGDRPDAYQRVVDRLLASPHYGEHWGRRWLDLARYADTNGYNIDVGRPIWPYRDWVIEALNANLPFDQFTIEQIAGDMLPDATQAQRIATGFHRNTMINEEGGVDPEEDRVKAIVDRVSTTATVWLGTTLACAQCHNHFFDPFTQREFFQLYAFFNNSKDRGGGEPSTSLEPLLYVLSPSQRTELRRIRSEIEDLGERQQERVEQLRKLETALLNAAPKTLVMGERLEPRSTRVHIRGDFLQLGDEVRPDVPAILPPLSVGSRTGPSANELEKVQGDAGPSHSKDPKRRADRLDLAHWLVSSNNPLVGRVTMNRHWQRFFGSGFVATSNDFGIQSESPTHLELLDWLAVEFMDTRWNIKQMHRLIVTSATYRQSSRVTPKMLAHDPQNRLLARGPRFRMDAEMIRDHALTVSGLLQRKIGGPSVYPPQPDGFWLEFGTKGFNMETWPNDSGTNRYRRGLYTFWRRTTAYPTFTVFDAPSRQDCTVQRSRTNTPLQALTTLNDPAFVEAAVALGQRILQRDDLSASQRVRFAFRLCVARNPQAAELERLVSLYEQQLENFQKSPQQAATFVNFESSQKQAGLKSPELAAWSVVATVLLNLDETVTKG